MRPTTSFALIVLLAGLAFAQEPKPPPIPVPAPPAQPEAAPPRQAPRAEGAINPYRRTVAATQRADEAALADKAAQDLKLATSLDRLLDEAVEATELDRETLRPAVEALRAQVRCERCGNTGFLNYSGLLQGEMVRLPCSYCRDKKQDAEADKRFAEALDKLPPEKRAFFAGWAAAKRKRVQDLTLFGGADLMTKESLRNLLAGQRQLELARRELDANGPALLEQQRVLNDAATALTVQRAKLADEMSALARLKIEGALDKPLIDRYRDLATTVDSAKAKVLLEEQLDKFKTTQAAQGSIEKQIQDLQAHRQAIDSAIERATTALVRERAERLHLEAKARDEAARALGEAVQSDPLAARPAVPPVPSAEPAQPAQPAQPTPKPKLRRPMTATTPEPPGPAGDEIRLLREELRKLRAEVEALRQKSDREPK
jgi:hypothetical protein